MKKFLTENWYKLMIGSSMVMASFGFMVYSISPAVANGKRQLSYADSNYKLVPTNDDGSINVKLSNEQLNEIIPKNEDGSINVNMAPNTLMDVNIRSIGNYTRSDAWPPRGILPVKIIN